MCLRGWLTRYCPVGPTTRQDIPPTARHRHVKVDCKGAGPCGRLRRNIECRNPCDDCSASWVPLGALPAQPASLNRGSDAHDAEKSRAATAELLCCNPTEHRWSPFAGCAVPAVAARQRTLRESAHLRSTEPSAVESGWVRCARQTCSRDCVFRCMHIPHDPSGNTQFKSC